MKNKSFKNFIAITLINGLGNPSCANIAHQIAGDKNETTLTAEQKATIPLPARQTETREERAWDIYNSLVEYHQGKTKNTPEFPKKLEIEEIISKIDELDPETAFELRTPQNHTIVHELVKTGSIKLFEHFTNTIFELKNEEIRESLARKITNLTRKQQHLQQKIEINENQQMPGALGAACNESLIKDLKSLRHQENQVKNSIKKIKKRIDQMSKKYHGMRSKAINCLNLQTQSSQFTPLHYAMFLGHTRIARFLIQNLDIDLSKDSGLGTPLTIARLKKDQEIINLLIAKGALEEAPRNISSTPSIYSNCSSRDSYAEDQPKPRANRFAWATKSGEITKTAVVKPNQ